ncbi:MAG: TusE/DsrC/DsvC family sulfur relay protein [Deltaproteobacteria bacterium]|nr:TusE/DsrC/DsvC family sulfur relay protein [Deltaproteobacteria bacterium]
MPALQVNGSTVNVNDEGFLVNPADWTEEVAAELARLENIQLTDAHWAVIQFCRKDFEDTGKSPGVRRITKVGGIPTKDMYSLFAGGPGKLAAKISGLAKPTGCL